MKNLLLFIIFFLHCISLSMDKQKQLEIKCKLLNLKSLIYSDPQKAALEIGALASNKSLEEIKRVQK